MRKWLRQWLGITDIAARVRVLDGGAIDDAKRFDGIDEAIAANETARIQDMTEIRERLEMPARKKASGRPFAVLAKIAEMGAQAERMKNAG